MRRASLYLAGLLLCALSCQGVYGQNCVLDMQPRYYPNVSWSVDGTTITTTVQVSGYTQVQIEPGCSLNGVTHQGQVYNSIAGTGGWVYGPSVWPPNSFTVTNTQTFTGTPGSTYTFNWVTQVYCSRLGIFWTQSGSVSIPIPPAPTVSFSSFTGVPKGGTLAVTATLNPSPSAISVHVRISRDQNTTGSATFSDDSTVKTINQTTNLELKGVTESSTANNFTLTAVPVDSYGNETGSPLASVQFTVVTVSLALRSSTNQTVSVDNAASMSYASYTGGTSTLGALVIQPSSCATGVEIVGTVTPNNYTGVVILKRTLLSYGKWDGSSQLDLQPNWNHDDTSNDSYRDDDPQSGSSAGKSYDVDVPGINSTLNHTYRVRRNFSEYAVLDSKTNTTPASSALAWYSAVSCQGTFTGPSLATDVANDNRAGTGSVNLTWNLQ